MSVMGAYCSVYSDMNDVMYIKYGTSMNALAWAGIATFITAPIATAGAAAPAVARTLEFTGLGPTNASKTLSGELKRYG
jgi:hypothetical protein